MSEKNTTILKMTRSDSCAKRAARVLFEFRDYRFDAPAGFEELPQFPWKLQVAHTDPTK